VIPLDWPCPLPGGGTAGEYALAFDKGRGHCLLIVPALFDEGNRLRRFTVEVMRRLDAAGIDCVLPDLPGTNESQRLLPSVTVEQWSEAMQAAASHFAATYVLGIRGGALFTPTGLPCWHYAPAKGAGILRQMLRARILSAREAGREEKREDLEARARAEGLELAGYALGAPFYSAFGALEPTREAGVIEQASLGGSGLWLRAEPGEDARQADALAAHLIDSMLS